MNQEQATVRTREAAGSKPKFEKPGPGIWGLDASHCQRPRSGWANELFENCYARGFRIGFERYGALLDTIEYRAVEGYPYISVRPLGAPPDAKGTPPKWLFKLLVMVHPAIRKRCARAVTAMNERVWREDITTFWRELPGEEAKITALATEPIQSMDDAAFLAHVERVYTLATERLLEHFRAATATMLPVGDFIAHAVRWTGVAPGAALAALRGHSPASVGGTRALEDVAEAILGSSEARDVLALDLPAGPLLERLAALGGPVAAALTKLWDRYGDVILSGHDVSELRLREMPELVVSTLRARVAAPTKHLDAQVEAEAFASSLRAQVPAEEQALFDEILADARAAYPLRDARCNVDFWALGVARRCLLEAGRRLAERGRIERDDDVFDLSQPELLATLSGTGGPTAKELGQRARWRRASNVADAPLTLGGIPGEPPPAEWLPGEAARAAAAMNAYLGLMWGEGEGATTKDLGVRGLGASPGRRTGRARLIRSAADFGKLMQGDILVATITTPAYNVILPLLGGVVTDRGGLLSHPAIVSREYGFPGVVGAKDATKKIPDGALVEIDGDAGTVKVLE